jgi:shikimate kinase
MHSDKIFLIGFMGSGKSTVGRKLASQLKWSYIDLDEKIESEAGMKITDIFSVKGESWFRELESKMLRSLDTETKAVISTGGGTPCFDDNMKYMLSTGITIYLKLTPAQLKSRLLRSSHQRPLIIGIGPDKLLGFIEDKLAEREKWYSEAEITVDRFNTQLSDLYLLVKKRIKK